MQETAVERRTLGQVGTGRENNLNLLRLVAAVLVIVCHAFPLTLGSAYGDPLSTWTDGRLSLGGLAVGVFLLMGGYLITASALRRPQLGSYAAARASRIFPELALTVLCCTFVLGPLVTTLSLGAYFGNSETWAYLLNIALWPHHGLPGVFESVPYPGVVNGALWVLPVQAVCYALAWVAVRLGFAQRSRGLWVAAALAAGGLVTGLVLGANSFLLAVARPVLLFGIGALAYIYRDDIVMDGRVALACGVAFCVLVGLRWDLAAMLLAFPYPFFYLAFATRRTLLAHPRLGENSYGMFLWGWPMEQLVVLGLGITPGSVAPTAWGLPAWLVVSVVACALAYLLGWGSRVACGAVLSAWRGRRAA